MLLTILQSESEGCVKGFDFLLAGAAAVSSGPPLIVDNFAGGGGASTGIEQALGRAVDIAINHDAEALAMHEINHPETTHIRNNIWRVDPKEVTQGRTVKLAWFSPDCTHHSKARGGKPREKHIRDLSWVVILWAEQVRPDMIFMENVEEIQSWGPLDPETKLPIKERRGEEWNKWLRSLRGHGYKVQFKELRACDYGAPTIRKRLFLIARCDGKRIKWPKPTHGKPGSPGVLSGKLKPYRTAADSVIDFSIPCPSIFTRKKPLADNTLRRIAHGIMKFVVNCSDPFIVPLTHGGGPGRAYPSSEPIHTITGANRGELAVITSHVTKFRTGAIGHDAREPFHTVTANGYEKRPGGAPPFGIVSAHLSKMASGNAPTGAEEPLQTVEGHAKHTLVDAVVAPVVTYAQQGGGNRSPLDPHQTVTASTKDQNCIATATLINTRNGEREGQAPRCWDVRTTYPTVTAQGSQGAVAEATLERLAVHIEQANGGPNNDHLAGRRADDPLSTIQTSGSQQRLVGTTLVPLQAAHLEQANGDGDRARPGRRADEPLSTVTTDGAHQRVVTSNIVKLKGTCRHGQPSDEPLATVGAQGTHLAETEATVQPLPLSEEALAGADRVYAFLLKYYGTDQDPRLLEPLHVVTTKDRFALVTVTINGEQYAIVDIGMRMLTPRELYNAQGFPPDYIIEFDFNGKPLTKSAQIEKCGNSVCPPMARALVSANLEEAEAETSAERMAA